MRLKPMEIEFIADRVVKTLTEKKLWQPKIDTHKLREMIVGILTRNMQEEEAIDKEAQRLLAQYDSQISQGSVDSRKMYTMIKQQLAKDRKFVL